MESMLLNDILVICGLGLAVVFACRKLGFPPIVGFFITGLLAGPYGLALISQVHAVEELAEIGVVCLLFTIGLEFSLTRLIEIKTLALFGGGLQVLAAIGVGAGAAYGLGAPPAKALFIGFLFSLSSTAIVLKLLQQRAELESPHGRLSFGILLFQDLAVIPMMLTLPFLAGHSESGGDSLLKLVGLMAAVAFVLFASAKWVVPHALYWIAGFPGREFFLLGIVFIALAIAWLVGLAGLSLPIGAFLAGLIISESEYSHRALGSMLPFHDLFTSFFFVSVGMLLDVGSLMQRPALILGGTCLIMGVKLAVTAAAALMLRLPLRTALLAGFVLCQVGEFAFVLAAAAGKLGLMEPFHSQMFLGMSVLTMLVAPFVIGHAEAAAELILKIPFPDTLRSGGPIGSEKEDKPQFTNHLIIIGYGLGGRHLALSATATEIPFVIIELNAETARREKKKGVPIFYGDASHESVLEHVGVQAARAMVIVISDRAATQRIILAARLLNPSIHIIVRERFLSRVDPLRELGADEVVAEDYESSMEILARVLTQYLVPPHEIEEVINRFRANHYRVFRTPLLPAAGVCALQHALPDSDIARARVGSDSPFAGMTLRELDFRNRYGVTILAIQRGSHTIANPPADHTLEPEDLLIMLGKPEYAAEAAKAVR